MGNKFLIVIIGLFAVIIANACLATATPLCNPQITLVNQDPNPATPNSYVKLLFEVSGLEKDTCSNGMAVKLSPEYPFSLDPNTDSVQALEGSTYIQNYKTTWMVPYTVRIADNALEGDYQIKMLYRLGSDRNFDSSYVEGYFNVTITDAQTDFDAVIQEVSGTQVSIGIVNTGKNTANSLIIGIPQQENFRTTGISQQIVGNLVAGDYTIITFNIASTVSRNMTGTGIPRNMTRETSSSEAQMLKIKIDYTDEIGERRSVIKEVQFSSSLLQGNLTGSFPSQTGRYSSQKSNISLWWYVSGVVVLLAAGAIICRKHRKKSKEQKKSHDEKGSEKNVPDWVLAERAHRKK